MGLGIHSCTGLAVKMCTYRGEVCCQGWHDLIGLQLIAPREGWWVARPTEAHDKSSKPDRCSYISIPRHMLMRRVACSGLQPVGFRGEGKEGGLISRMPGSTVRAQGPQVCAHLQADAASGSPSCLLGPCTSARRMQQAQAWRQLSAPCMCPRLHLCKDPHLDPQSCRCR